MVCFSFIWQKSHSCLHVVHTAAWMGQPVSPLAQHSQLLSASMAPNSLLQVGGNLPYTHTQKNKNDFIDQTGNFSFISLIPYV